VRSTIGRNSGASRSRFIAAAAIAALIGVVAAGAGAARGADAKSTRGAAASCAGTSINIGTNADANNINPILAVDLDGRWRTDLMFDPLVQVDPKTMAAVPHLAESWQVSRDNKTYTFHLRKGVKFHDGVPLTTKDVAFTVMSILDPKYQGPFQADWARLIGADKVISGSAKTLPGLKVINATTIRMTLERPYAGFLTSMARQLKPLPEHLLKGQGPLATSSEFSLHPVGSGPYKMVQWLQGSKFVVEAWPAYWGGVACMKTITQSVIPDTNTLASALQSGQVDASIIPPPSAISTLKNDPNLSVYQMAPMTAEGLEFNMTKEPWKSNAKLRLAIASAIDYGAFAKQFMGTDNPKPAGYFSWGSWAYDGSVSLPSYNPAKAKQLLAEAGYPDGKGLSITISTNAGNAFRAQETTYVQAQLAKLGVDVQLTQSVWGTFIAAVNDHSYDMAAMNNGDNAGIPDPTSLQPNLTCDSGVNYSAYCNPKVDKLFAQAAAILDRKQRKKLYTQIQKILAQDLPFIPGFWRPNSLVVKKSIKNVNPSVIGAYWNIQTWSNK
jgi:peptide/nickel transport system substrate-binding protein